MRKAAKKQNVSTTKNEKLSVFKNRNKGKYRRVKNLYRNCILMEEPSHSFTVWSLPGNSFIAFRISLVLLVHSFQTDFIFEIILRCFQRSVYPIFIHFYFRFVSEEIIQGIMVISGTIDIFWCKPRYGFLQKLLNKVTCMWRHPILGKNLFACIFYWEQEIIIVFNCLQLFLIVYF